ncbi:hypothetical protein ABZ078_28555 [Streptomyces sp. NPDC006385]|uniref:hypothetical protein n=1 Tax=Streptomyces sp. NPDC006385 TaxID=3156761 RepID=UPI0033AA6072
MLTGWTTDASDGTLTVAPGSTGHGRELRIRTQGNGRAFLVLPDLTGPGNSYWAHWTIAEASGQDSPTLVRPLGGQGIEQPDLTVSTHHHGGTSDPFVFPAFDRLKLGWQLYQADPTPSSYDVRLDDIAVSTRRMGGCGA